jgi:GPH family glycoside/pentoside/hexuronide:cation symporter
MVKENSGTAAVGERDQIPFLEKVVFATGDMAFNLIWMPLAIFANPYFTDICKIPASWVGWIFLGVRSFDLVTDVGMGIIGDRTTPHKKYGKFRLYIAWGAIPLAVAGAAMFYAPEYSLVGKAIYLGIVYLMLSLLYTLTNVPYSAQMTIMSADHNERTRLSAIRMVGAQTGVLIVSLLMLKIVDILGDGNPKAGYFYTMSLFGIIVATCLMLTANYSKDRVQPKAVDTATTKKNLAEMAKCIPWWLLLVVGLFTTFALTIRFGSIMYYIKYYLDQEAIKSWGGIDGVASIFFTSGTICALAGSAIYGAISKKFDKKAVYIVCILACAVTSVAFSFIPPDGIVALITIQIIFSLLMGPTGAIMFATYTDVAAYLKHKKGNDTEGLAMSIGSLCNKSGWSIGPTLTLILLGLINYTPDVEQSQEILDALVAMMSWGPAAACIVAFFGIAFYPLNRKRMDQIQADLKQRAAV